MYMVETWPWSQSQVSLGWSAHAWMHGTIMTAVPITCKLQAHMLTASLRSKCLPALHTASRDIPAL